MSARLFLLDGSALFYRAFFALQRTGLVNRRGEPTGAVLGFANALAMLIREERPEYLAVVFDPPGPTFRHETYPEYKATRASMPDELRQQVPWVRELVDVWPAARLEVPGMEADDVIGAYCAQLAGPDLEVVAVTGDKDFYQLLGEHVRILNPGRGGASAVEAKLIGPDDIAAKFGVRRADQVIDVLALMGDASDNVPGVPGVGPKTAARLIEKHASLEGVYRNLGSLKPAMQKKLEENREMAFLSRDLVTIRTDLDLPVPLPELRSKPPGGNDLIEFLTRMDFANLLKELAPGSVSEPAPSLLPPAEDYVLVSNEEGLVRLGERLGRAGSGFAVGALGSLDDPMRAELLGISIAAGPGEAYLVNLGFADGADPLPLPAVREVLGPILADASLPKVTHHGKPDLLLLQRNGLAVSGLEFDTGIASYLLDPEASHRLEDLARDRLGETLVPRSELVGQRAAKRPLAEVKASRVTGYGAGRADMTLRLRDALRPKLESMALDSLFREIEMPLVPVLLGMERTGVAVDVKFLQTMSQEMETELERREAACRDRAGTDFNVNSPKQLAEVLFERLALPRGKRTKTGYSTDSEVLEGLREHHPLPAAVLEYRQIAKLKSTYVDALPALVNPETGRIHASFNQTVAATGRLSSSDPNLQNIPTRTPLGRKVRRAFIPGETDWVLISADYSQIELRIMAHLSGDPVLLDAFRGGVDVHRDTAARIFGVDPGEVTEEQRGQAKTVNFAVLYGQGPYGLARTLGIPNREASEFIQAYRAQYSGVMAYLDETLVKAKRRGFVTTLLKRRRYLPGLRFKSAAARAAAERLAVNTPVQGSAADLIKAAMVRLHTRLAGEESRARLLMQVHDELVLEAPRAQAERVGEMVRSTMETALDLRVPVVVNVGIGANWAEIH